MGRAQGSLTHFIHNSWRVNTKLRPLGSLSLPAVLAAPVAKLATSTAELPPNYRRVRQPETFLELQYYVSTPFLRQFSDL